MVPPLPCPSSRHKQTALMQAEDTLAPPSENRLELRFHPFPSGWPASSALRASLDKFIHCWASLSHPCYTWALWAVLYFFVCFHLILMLTSAKTIPLFFVLVAFLQVAEKAAERFNAVSSLCWWTTALCPVKNTEPVCMHSESPHSTLYGIVDRVSVNTATPI